MKIERINSTCTLQLIKKPEFYKDNLSTILMEAIEESFEIFINPKKYNIFNYLEQEYGLTKQNIPKNIDKFVSIIEDLFGVGAKLIEIRIIELIHNKIQNFAYNPRNHDLFLKEYLVALFYTI